MLAPPRRPDGANLDQSGGEGPSAAEAGLLHVEFVGEGLRTVGEECEVARMRPRHRGNGGAGRPGSRHLTGRRTPKAGAPPEPLIGHSPLREHARLVAAASAEEVDEVLPTERSGLG